MFLRSGEIGERVQNQGRSVKRGGALDLIEDYIRGKTVKSWKKMWLAETRWHYKSCSFLGAILGKKDFLLVRCLNRLCRLLGEEEGITS